MTYRKLDQLVHELLGTDVDLSFAARLLSLDCPAGKLRRSLVQHSHLWQCHNCGVWTKRHSCRKCVGSDSPTYSAVELVGSGDLRFIYHVIHHRGEHLPTLYAIPRPWREESDTKAETELAERTDRDCYVAIQRWKRTRRIDVFSEVLIYSLRWVTIIADKAVRKFSPGRNSHPRDWGDAIWICVGAAHDAIYNLPYHDPVDWGDDIELHPDGKKYRRHRGRFYCEPYVRYIRDAAQRAINEASKESRRMERCGDACRGNTFETATKIPHFSCGLQSEVEHEVWTKELLEQSHNTNDVSLDQPIWLNRLKWINRCITGNKECDVLHRAVLETHMLNIHVNEEGDAIPTMRHDEIADDVARKTGITRHASTIGRILDHYRSQCAEELGVAPGKVRRAKSQKRQLGRAG